MSFVPNLEEFFASLLHTIYEAFDRLNAQYELNRTDSVEVRHDKYEQTLGLFLSRLAQRYGCQQVVGGIRGILNEVREIYLARNKITAFSVSIVSR